MNIDGIYNNLRVRLVNVIGTGIDRTTDEVAEWKVVRR